MTPELFPGDVVIASFPGAFVTKTRPALVLSSALYHATRPDVILGVITSRSAVPLCPTDFQIVDWPQAGLHAPSTFRLYVVTLLQSDVRPIGKLSTGDWNEVTRCIAIGLNGSAR